MTVRTESSACLVLLGFLCGLAGCQHYQPQPLNPSTFDQALALPGADVLQVEASQIDHPILQPVSLGDGDGLTPDAAAVLAVIVNPNLRAVRDERGLADAQLLQAGLLPNPQLGAAFENPSFGNTTDTVSAYGFGLSWDIQQLLTRGAQRDAAALNRESIEMDVAWQEWQVAEAAKMAVYQLANLESQNGLLEDVTARLSDNLERIRQAAHAQLVTDLELMAAETAANQARASLLDSQKQTALQRLELNRLIGLPADTPIRLKPDLKLNVPWDEADSPYFLENLENRRLDLIALQRGYESQEAAVRSAILAQFPRINLGLARTRDTGNVGTIGGFATIDLPIFDHNQGAIALERATRTRLFDEYTARVFEARAEIASLLTEAVHLQRQITAARAAEPDLDRLVTHYRIAVSAGQADVLSYYFAWNELAQKRIELLALDQQLLRTRIALELASGRYISPGSTGSESLQP